MARKILLAIVAGAGVMALCVLIHSALVRDAFAAHSNLGGYYAIGGSRTLDLSHIDEWNKAAQDKYGPRSSTGIRNSSWEVFVEGKVVETRPFSTRPLSAYGVFMVPRKGVFPFEVSLEPGHVPDQVLVTDDIKRNLARVIRPEALKFEAVDWELAHCHSPARPSFGVLAPALRLGSNEVCLTRLNAAGSGTFVMGYAVVYGEFWTRPLSKRICRILSTSWVNAMMSQPGVKRPDFVGCLLANRRSEGSDASKEVPSPHFFEVRDDSSVAVID